MSRHIPDTPSRAMPDALSGTCPEAALQARARFPRGLVQPDGSFRFSVDALLLAAFAGEALAGTKKRMTHAGGGNAAAPETTDMPGAPGHGKPVAFADLGAGCGVVGLALLLAHPRLTGTGIDIDEELADAARRNAARLGLTERFRVLRADLAAPGDAASPEAPAFDALPPAGSMDLVAANPPYRLPGSGRLSPSRQRTRALFETHGTLPAFAEAAARLLRAGGRSCWVYGPDRLPDLLLALRATGQEPKRLRCVHSRAHGPATLVLVEARRAGRPGLVVEPPLILCAGEGAATALTGEALAFCPLLACNAGAGGKGAPPFSALART
ncbi:tRNA1(Val) (adenine(37)-N6)-methyltransferase [Nitratidesulfovibrio sp. 1201_IL3209]|uniref:tRNA1(Val) (adenine(37)-N6)-methyltransferase n=1 Tax=Nitratidesulfovibrio sp. 1201_IL3209 TaxID=3084053 RepID=UPI002FD94C2C